MLLYLVCLVWVLFNMMSGSAIVTNWVNLELISIVFLGLWVSNTNDSQLGASLEYGLLYYIVQCFGSLLFLIGWIEVGLMVKLGVIPFHWWCVSIMRTMESQIIVVFSTLQKMPVVLLLRELSLSVGVLVMVSCLVSSVLCLLATSPNVLLAWSGICNTSLLVICGQISCYLLFTFLVGYSLALMHYMSDISLLSSLHLAGIPPYPLFWVKLSMVIWLSSGLASILLVSSLVLWWSYHSMATPKSLSI